MEQQVPVNIPFIILLGGLGMLVLSLGIILMVIIYQKRMLRQQNALQAAETQYQQELLKATIDSQENERERIAKNLHDDVGALLSAVRLNLGRLSLRTKQESDLPVLIRETDGLIDNVLENIRSISSDLVPPVLERFGLAVSLRNLCLQLNTSGLIHTEVQLEGEEYRLPRKAELQLFRITKEVVNNTLKHSGASHIEIMLQHSPGNLQICISHNGKGLTHAQALLLLETQKGLGLKSIESRARSIQALIQYIYIDAQHSKVLITLPVDEKN